MQQCFYKKFFLSFVLFFTITSSAFSVFSPGNGMGGGNMYGGGPGMGGASGGGMYGGTSGGMYGGTSGGSMYGSNNSMGGAGNMGMNNPMYGAGGSMGSNGAPSPDLSQIGQDISKTLQNAMGNGLAGLYVGLGLGYVNIHGGQYYRGPSIPGGNPVGYGKISAGGLQLSLYGGHGIIVQQRFYVGGEVNVGYSTAKDKNVKFSQGVNVGLAGRAGPVFDNKYLAYFKLSVNGTNYRWTPWAKSLNFFGFDAGPGIGFEMMLGNRGTARIEFDYGIAVGKKGVSQNVNATWKKMPSKFKVLLGVGLKV